MGQPTMDPPRYSLVFIIHGDASYLYHDALGNSRQADEDVLARAQDIATRNTQADVFIFHEIERRHVLFLIPRKDGRAYHYRNGQLLASKSYWRDQGTSRFDPEVQLYREFTGAEERPPVHMVFYFGHELPEFNEAGYDNSYSKRIVTIHDLAAGLRDFAGGSTRIDLFALATCFGGTPHTIGALAPYARFIVASPDNLHLSYFDLEPLAQLNVGTDNGAIAAFADRFARNAFDKLAGDVQTTVSVGVYNTDEVGDFIASVSGAYNNTLVTVADLAPDAASRCDCADDPTYAIPGIDNGVTVLYRAPRFGRMKNDQHHSGWKCWRLVN